MFIHAHVKIIAAALLLLLDGGVHAYQLEASPDRSLQEDDTCHWTLVTGNSPCQLLADTGGENTDVVVDGNCNFNPKLGFYIAVCTDNAEDGNVIFRRAHCSQPDCTDCKEFVDGCDVGRDECGFMAQNEIRNSASCSQREDPFSFEVDIGYGVIGSCASPTCATTSTLPLPEDPCYWYLRTDQSCREFTPTGPSVQILTDGNCNYNDDIGYYIAVCTVREKLTFRRAYCSNSDCSDCNEFYTGCDFENGDCGMLARDLELLSGQCLQIVDGNDNRILAYDAIGTCGSPTCAYSTDDIPPSPPPTPYPTMGPTPPPTPPPTTENQGNVIITLTLPPTTGPPSGPPPPTVAETSPPATTTPATPPPDTTTPVTSPPVTTTPVPPPSATPTRLPTQRPTTSPTRAPLRPPTPEPSSTSAPTPQEESSTSSSTGTDDASSATLVRGSIGCLISALFSFLLL